MLREDGGRMFEEERSTGGLRVKVAYKRGHLA